MKKIDWKEIKQLRIKVIGIALLSLSIVAGGVFAYSQSIKPASSVKGGSQNQQDQNNIKKVAVDDKDDEVPAPVNQNDIGVTSNQIKTATKPVTAPVATSETPPATTPTPPAEPSYPDTYPSSWANAPQDSIIDTWGMSNRESVSYTAWKVNEAFGNMPAWGRQGKGNAVQWPAAAQNASISTGSAPKVHSVGIAIKNGIPGIGLSGWVEAINGDNITVSSYNWGTIGTYALKTVPATYFETYIYFGG